MGRPRHRASLASSAPGLMCSACNGVTDTMPPGSSNSGGNNTGSGNNSSNNSSPASKRRRRCQCKASTRSQTDDVSASRGRALVADRWLVIGAIVLVAWASLRVHQLHDASVGRLLPDTLFLSPEELPGGQGLTLKERRAKTGTDCTAFGVADDPYFARHGGTFCGKAHWEAAVRKPQPEHHVHTVDTVFKVFRSEEQAAEYHRRYWGRHLYEPIPRSFWIDMLASDPYQPAPVHTGTHLSRAFYWDPSLINVAPLGTMMPQDVPNNNIDPALNAKHFVHILRLGRVFVKVLVSGYPGAQDPALNFDVVSRIVEHTAVRVLAAHPSDNEVRVRRAILPCVRIARAVATQTTRLVDMLGKLLPSLPEMPSLNLAPVSLDVSFARLPSPTGLLLWVFEQAGASLPMVSSEASEACSQDVDLDCHDLNASFSDDDDAAIGGSWDTSFRLAAASFVLLLVGLAAVDAMPASQPPKAYQPAPG
eukprot:m.42306 g.42306  ORF g.42306 m.42306 type:complete len:478 (+) comp11534_c1_seq1:142-1575(+)